MGNFDLTPYLRSPRLPDIVATLNVRLQTETAIRERWYDELVEDENVEFINGEFIKHQSHCNRDLSARMQLTILLGTYVDIHNLGEVRDASCLCVFPRNDYEPDIVFFGPEKSATFTPDTMKFPIPDFVVEILSDSTESRDRGVKFEDFEAHGVSEYWIVDAAAETVEQYAIEDGAFRLLLKSGSREVASRVIAGFRIPIRAIFDPEENLSTLKKLLS